jgi:glycerol-3-phosphate cytidylyltransferase
MDAGGKTMIVYTGGTFDFFHAGHVNFLRACSRYGSVVVALNTDEFVEAYKGKKPLMPYHEREAVLRACRWVSDVVPNLSGADSKPTIVSVNPDYIIVGDDWEKKDYYKQMSFTKEWLEERGIVLRYLPYTKGVSTTELKKRLLK